MSKDLGPSPGGLLVSLDLGLSQGVWGSSAGEAVFMACSLGLMGLHLSKLRCVNKLPVGVIELDSSVVEISVSIH